MGYIQLHPLVVDLDGTLIHTDMLHESAVRLLRERPLLLFMLPKWLSDGKAALKENISKHLKVDIASLPFNKELIEWLKYQKKLGRKLVLCTAADISIAKSIANKLDLFNEVLASNGKINLEGINKVTLLVEMYGEKGFDYVGNSNADLSVWLYARKAIIVNGSSNLIKKAESLTEVIRIFPRRKCGFEAWIKVFRLHQWIKNLLLFVPIFAAHQALTTQSGYDLLVAFFAFSLCASSIYILNDLFDIESDRQHSRKCYRPFACGLVPIWAGVVLAPLLITISLILGAYVSGNFFFWLLGYLGLTCAYSWGLKRLVLVDCLLLAVLYTLRIVAGASAVSIPLSFWLLTFSIFLFLSLAFIKRYAELQIYIRAGSEKAHGRGYYTTDLSLVQQLGVTSGFASILVLALYLNSDNVLKLYSNPEILWAAVPLMLLWVSWMWLIANRGQMHDDPIAFAIKDRISLIIGFLLIATFVLAGIL